MSTNNRPYQVCLYCGENQPAIDGVKVVNVTPKSSSVEDVAASIVDSGLSPAVFRSRVLFAFDDFSTFDEVAMVVQAYAAWLGFAARRIDVACGDTVVVADDLIDHVNSLPDAGKPSELFDQVQIGASRDDDLLVVGQTGLDEATVSALKFSRRCRFVPPLSALDAVTAFLTVASIRARGSNDRFPFLVQGDEPQEFSPDQPPGVCLDDLRRRSQELRSSLRGGNREAIVDPQELSSRRRKLLAASACDIASTLARLGVASNPETGLWHCPRPSRHTNRDANASMKVSKGQARCFRCDPERVDSLRLVMDSVDMTPDEAADWLLSDSSLSAPPG